MTVEYQIRIMKKLNSFWKTDDKIICEKIFTKKNSECQLCGHSPILWCHQIYNSNSNESMIVGSCCIVNMSIIMKKVINENRLYIYDKYAKASERFNQLHPNMFSLVGTPPKFAGTSHSLLSDDLIDYFEKFEEVVIIDDNSFDDLAPEGTGWDELED